MYTCTTELRNQIQANLDRFDNRSDVNTEHIHAAVALTVVNGESEAALIITRRSPRLKDHSSQWAIPGGRVDAGEAALDAALRELSEEVSLDLKRDSFMGQLDDYVTRSGYRITPLVFWSAADIHALVANPDEVASIVPFPFRELARDDAPILESIAASDREVLSMPFHDSCVYSPTAAMLYQFREVAMLGRQTRVAHYDQPQFAWK